MSRIRLDRAWTDAEGMHHRAGDTVDVDDETLAELRDAGVVAEGVETERPQRWAGPAESAAADINDTDVY